MPIVRGLQRAPVWNSSGYVCYSCRHKLLVGRRPLTRSQTNLSPSEGGGDDWAFNFNDLSDLPHSSRKTGATGSSTAKKENEPSEKEPGQVDGNGSKRGGRNGEARGHRNVLFEGLVNGQSGSPAKETQTTAKAMAMNNTLSSLGMSLKQRVPSASAEGDKPSSTEAENDAEASLSVPISHSTAFNRRKTRLSAKRQHEAKKRSRAFYGKSPLAEKPAANEAGPNNMKVAKEGEATGSLAESQNPAFDRPPANENEPNSDEVAKDGEAVDSSSPSKAMAEAAEFYNHFTSSENLGEAMTYYSPHLEPDSAEANTTNNVPNNTEAAKDEEATDSPLSSKTTAFEGPKERLSPSKQRAKNREGYLLRRRQKRAREDHKRVARESTEAISASSPNHDSRTQLETFVERFSTRGIMQELIDALRRDTKKDEFGTVSNDKGVPETESSSAALPERPTFAATSPPIPSHYRPFLEVSSDTTSERQSESTQSKESKPFKVPTFAATSSTTPSYTRTSSVSRPDKPLSLAQKVEESRDRPKWGGIAPPLRGRTAQMAVSELVEPPAKPEAASSSRRDDAPIAVSEMLEPRAKSDTAASSRDEDGKNGLSGSLHKDSKPDTAVSSRTQDGNTNFLDSLRKAAEADGAVPSKADDGTDASQDSYPTLSKIAYRFPSVSRMWRTSWSTDSHIPAEKEKQSAADRESTRAMFKPIGSASKRMDGLRQSLSAEFGGSSKRKASRGMNDESLNMLVSSSENTTFAVEPYEESGDDIEETSRPASSEQSDTKNGSDATSTKAPSSSTLQKPEFPKFMGPTIPKAPVESAHEERFAAVSNAFSGENGSTETEPREESSNEVEEESDPATSELTAIEKDSNATSTASPPSPTSAKPTVRRYAPLRIRKSKSDSKILLGFNDNVETEPHNESGNGLEEVSGPASSERVDIQNGSEATSAYSHSSLDMPKPIVVRKAAATVDEAEQRYGAARAAALSKNEEYYSNRPNALETSAADSDKHNAEGERTETDAASSRLASLHLRQAAVHDRTLLLRKEAEDALEPYQNETTIVDAAPLAKIENDGAVRTSEKRTEDFEAEGLPGNKSEMHVAPTNRPAKLQSSEASPKLNARELSAGGQKRLARSLKKEHRQVAVRGERPKNDRVVGVYKSVREPPADADDSVPTLGLSNAKGEMFAAVQNDMPGEHQSAASHGGGGDDNDDGDHKPLWEVMSKAEALTGKVPSNAEAANEIEQSEQPEPPPLDLSSSEPADVLTIKPSSLNVKPLNIPQPPVPGLEYGLDRVLFNPGVYQLQDPLSRVYNFDPYLQKIMPVVEFDFNALKEYKTSSQDTMLSALANEHGKRYIGSTSSMTGMLGHFHYLLSDWRPLNLNMLSRGFTDKLDSFTLLNRAPNAIFLRWKNGTYAIDADKQYDSGNVLMLLGKSMEKLLTMPTSEYERYRKSDPRTVSEVERTAPETFEYTTMGDFLMRSQLDAHDPRLPGTGMFDLKTRAVISVRMDAEDFQPMTGYEIHTLQGRFGSYEREFYDMMRSTMLKYMLQARMGRMDGIFVAYHNVERIFGFQYLPIQDMDRAIHGQVDRCLGDQEFRTSLELVNRVFDKATAKFPEQSLRFHFETTTESLGTGNPTTVMWIFAEPMKESEIERIQSTSNAKVAEFERTMMGVEKDTNLTTTSAEAVAANHGDRAITGPVDANVANATRSPSPRAPSASSTTASEYITSSSGADPEFLNSIASSEPLERKPLFAASLICKSRVNGMSAQRPESLKSADTWEVEYLLREWNAPDAMWARYEQMKARRQQLFEKLRSEEEMAEDNGNGELTSKQKRERAYIDFLRSMSQSGREFRNKIDQLEAGKEPVIVGHTPTRIVEEEVGNVDEYMAWLYRSEKV